MEKPYRFGLKFVRMPTKWIGVLQLQFNLKIFAWSGVN